MDLDYTKYDQEEIQACLKCKRPECVNCFHIRGSQRAYKDYAERLQTFRTLRDAGLTDKQIAEKLNVLVGTIKSYHRKEARCV